MSIKRRIIRIGERRNEPRKRILAALATGRVESNFRNLSGGDADSAGWRQERRSLYRNPRNVRASINRFYNEADQLDRGQSAGQLAADVQRPAAQYRGRYAQVMGEARQILARHGGGGGMARTTSAPGANGPLFKFGTRNVLDRAGYQQAQRRQILAQFLQREGKGNSVLFRSGLLSTATPDPADFTSNTLTSKLVGKGAQAQLQAQLQGKTPANGQVRSAITAARRKLGVHEINGSNRSREVDQMERSFGMVGQPWCGIFVGTVLREAGVRGITSRVASVAAIEQDAKRGTGGFGSWHSPRHAKKGDALVVGSGSHVVFVTRVDRKRGLIHTIGGNTSNGAVRRVTYRMDQVHGVARPRYR